MTSINIVSTNCRRLPSPCATRMLEQLDLSPPPPLYTIPISSVLGVRSTLILPWVATPLPFPAMKTF
ncbi:hypothetical protein AZE42_10751, partial [Rhizopogon vesiculosus]